MSFAAGLATIKGILKGGSGEGIKAVTGLIDKFNLSKEEKESFKVEYEKMRIAEETAKADRAVKEIELILNDTANARAMQIAALGQDDKFSKRYVYYLSSFIIVSAVAFGTMLFFVNVPPQNQRMVEMFADIFLFAGGITIINFFFGSSSGSKKSGEVMREAAREKIKN